MVLPKEGSGYEIEANGLTRKGAKNPAAKQFLDWAITDESSFMTGAEMIIDGGFMAQ
jgi:ABC-type Fe3+ transport system substrate-binding protein